jgi:hypothetical protein
MSFPSFLSQQISVCRLALESVPTSQEEGMQGRESKEKPAERLAKACIGTGSEIAAPVRGARDSRHHDIVAKTAVTILEAGDRFVDAR